MTLSLPTPSQALLLRAVTQSAPEAVAAWEAWQAGVAVDDLEPDSQWLLPLLFVRLQAAGVDAAGLERYANVYRHNWYKNQLRLNALRPMWAALETRGHRPVLVGGAALAAACYPALGARPFAALALAVPGLTADDARAAERLYRADVGAGLRWHTGPPVEGTRTVSVAGQVLCVPDPAEMLVQVLAGTEERNDASVLLWATDAVVVSQRLDEAGWASVWRRAAALDVTEPARARWAWLDAVGLLAPTRTEAQPA